MQSFSVLNKIDAEFKFEDCEVSGFYRTILNAGEK
jgi:hypothetical protein